jgi:DNA polymerase III alpha subunit
MDIDIDLPTDFKAKDYFEWTRASIVKNDILSPHPCGYYPQDISTDPITGLSAIPYDKAEELGYTKIDFLHLGVYNDFTSRKQIEELINKEPDWNLLLVPSIQKKLFQLSNHGDVLNEIKPRSVVELADVLALIRPGKKNLIKLYKSQKESTRRILYAKDETGYSFKKSHAIAYAYVIVLQLHALAGSSL